MEQLIDEREPETQTTKGTKMNETTNARELTLGFIAQCSKKEFAEIKKAVSRRRREMKRERLSAQLTRLSAGEKAAMLQLLQMAS